MHLENRVVPVGNLTIHDAPVGVYPTFDFVDPNPNPGGSFGQQIVSLNNGNVVITDPDDNAGGVSAGAVYLFRISTGELLSTLTGSSQSDSVGSSGVVALENGNFLVLSPNWNNGTQQQAGAVTFGSGTTGVNGPVSASNSVVGSTKFNQVGFGGVQILNNGNFVIKSPLWDNGLLANAGAVTFGHSVFGVSGVVSATNSLIGSSANDGEFSNVIPLSNGNFVVSHPFWDNGAAANAGAVTFGNGISGLTGVISKTNSIVGSQAEDLVGEVTALSNGNYLIGSAFWNRGTVIDAGAVTFCNGQTGSVGIVSPANSLVGASEADLIGRFVFETKFSNYLVHSTTWNRDAIPDAGAVTFGNGSNGVVGEVTPANSLVGSHKDDFQGASIVMLANGNYVVAAPNWDDASVANAGAVTFGTALTGVVGSVSKAISLIGTTAEDRVGISGVTPLTSGHYVVISDAWNSVGAVTFGNGETGLAGTVTPSNSLVGSIAFDAVGQGGVTALSNGNYVVNSPIWNGVGAVTFGLGSVGTSGVVSPSNSLVGSTGSDLFGGFGKPAVVTALGNGNYVVQSPYWDNGSVIDAGAVTFGSGFAGITGVISPANSLVGSSENDRVGLSLTPLNGGGYVVQSTNWANGTATRAGAVTYGNGLSALTGPVSPANSLVGTTADDFVGVAVTALAFGNFVVSSPYWNNGTTLDSGAITFVDRTIPVVGPVGLVNSLIGSNPADLYDGVVTPLANGNYVAVNRRWDNGTALDAGAVTFGNGTTGVSGIISATNSLLGSSPSDAIGEFGVTDLFNGHYVVSSRAWRNNGFTNAGAVTIVEDTTGFTADNVVGGVITPQNSAIGKSTNAILQPNFPNYSPITVLVRSSGNGGGAAVILTKLNFLTYSLGGDRDFALTTTIMERMLNRGETVQFQASGTLSINSPLTVLNPFGLGGPLTLESMNAIALNASLDTDNGNLTLIGTTILPAAGVSITTGAGTLNLPSGKLVLKQTLVVNGEVNLSGVSLSALLTLPAVLGQSVTLIDKQPVGPITGTFSGLAQGADLTLNGLNYSISYTGGNGNDVILTRTNPPGNTAPTISDVTNQSSAGSPVGPLAFSIDDAQTAADSLVITRSSSNTALLPLANIVLGGSGANRTVTVTPASGQTGSATVTLTVTDEGGLTATDTFTLTVTDPNTPPTISDVTNQSSAGSPVGPLAFTVGDAQTPADSLVVSRSSSNTTLLPLANIILGGIGANRTVTVTPASGQTGSATITLTVTDEGGLTATDTFTLTVTVPPTLVGFKQFGVGADVGNSTVNFYNPDGTIRFALTPFPGQPGGIRTASGDFTGDGVADLVVGTGPGGPTHVKVFNGVTQAELFSVDPFEAAFTGGVYVAAGDINGDGIADLVITPDEGGGPRVRAFTGSGFTQMADFFGIDDKNFRGGARASIGDLNGDGSGDLIVVAGFGGGPRVAAFDGAQLQTSGRPKLFNDFFAFEQALRNGIFVAAGDVNGDGFADLVAGGGPGGGPRVYILDGKSLVQNGSGSLVPVGNFFAGDPANRGGVRVAVKDLDNDAKADVITGAGTGAGSRVTAYRGTTITPTGGTPSPFLDFDAFAGFGGGVFVG